jgi:hypothetical protein
MKRRKQRGEATARSVPFCGSRSPFWTAGPGTAIAAQSGFRGGGARGSVVVKALCYKPEGHGFDNDEVNFLIYLILPAELDPRVYSASNRNEYQKHKNNNVSG